MESLVSAAEKVLLVWDGTVDAEAMKQFAEKLQAAVGAQGKVSVENAERLEMGKCLQENNVMYPSSWYNRNDGVSVW